MNKFLKVLSSHCRQLNFPWVSRRLLEHNYRAREAEGGAAPLEEPALVVVVVFIVTGAGQLTRAVLAGRTDPGGHGGRLRDDFKRYGQARAVFIAFL